MYQCKVCNIVVNSREQLSFHEQGKAHQKRLRLQSQQSIFNPPSGYSQMSSMSSISHSEADSGIGYSNVGNLDSILSDIPTSPAHDLHAKKQTVERPIGLGSNCVRCDVCNIWTNTLEVLEKHKQGKDHIKKLNKLSLQKATNLFNSSSSVQKTAVLDNVAGNQLCCNICNIFCNTQDQLNIHMQGKPHAKKAAQQSALKSFSGEAAEKPCSYSSGVSSRTIRDDESDLFGPTVTSSGNSNTSTNWQQTELVQLTKHAGQHIQQRNDPFDDQFAIPMTGHLSFDNINVPVSAPSSNQKGIISPSVTPLYYDKTGLDETIPTVNTTSSSSLSPVSTETSFDVAVRRGYVLPMNQDFQCTICNSVSNTKDQMLVHLGGKKHIQKLTRAGYSSEAADLRSVAQKDSEMDSLTQKMSYLSCSGGNTQPEISEAIKQGVLSYDNNNGLYNCNACNYQLPPNNVISHLKGKTHLNYYAKNMKIPVTDVQALKPIRKAISPDKIPEMQQHPRDYQKEVYTKALRHDCIVFMPTGTGKTLVACMLIAKMLDENPGRQIVFLVDKVLLVIQQAGVLREQLKDIKVSRCENRFDVHSKIIKRNILIAAICGDYVELTETLPLFQQDILVVTAAYYSNLLEKNTVSWSHLCLAIFDEAHHCTKDHPYNKLLQNYHLPSFKSVPTGYQCKIVGLTASPAGALNLQRTEKRLEDLLLAMGNLKMVSVMDNHEELLQFIPKVRVQTRLVEFLPHELQLRMCYISYLNALFRRKFHVYAPQTILKLKSLVSSCFTFTEPDSSFEVDMSSEQLDNFNNLIRKFKNLCSDEQEDKMIVSKFMVLLNHFQHIVSQMIKLDAIGWVQMKEEVRYLLGFPSSDRETVSSFQELGNLDEDCRVCINHLKLKVKAIDHASSQNFSIDLTSIARELLKEIKTVQSSCPPDKRMLILVLAKERCLPWSLKEYLSCETNLKVTALVGHGTTSGDAKGMTVQQQKNELTSIKQSKYEVIVATPVAEEGIDLPSCDLVILLNPPTSVQALVQMRGRARKLKSRFLIFCRESIEVDQIHQLERREEHMIEAARKISMEQSKSTSI